MMILIKLKKEFEKSHQIAGLSFKDAVDKKPIHEKIMEVKNYIEKVVSSGHDGVSGTALFDNFEAGIINGLLESGQLIKLPGKDLYVWSSV